MSYLNRCTKLVSPLLKRSVLREQPGVYRGACSSPRAQCHSLCSSHRRVTPSSASCQRRPHVFSGHIDTVRCYSDVCYESSNSQRGTGLSQEESHEDMDRRSRAPSQRLPETFTLDVLVSLLRQENAVDICVINVPDQIKYADYFIVVSGVSSRHLRAMALYAMKVYKILKKDNDPNVKIEGKDTEDWMCIDFGNMVVHFMLPETRDVYELEKLWTLRNCDEQLSSIPAEKLPEDFIYDADMTK